MPAKKPAQPSLRNSVNPFAHLEARKKAEEAEKAAAAAKRKTAQAAVKKEVKTKSWSDYPFDAMKGVGDYLRGVKK